MKDRLLAHGTGVPSRRDVMAGLAGLAGISALPAALGQTTPAPHYVYVESNIGTANGNSLFAWSRDAAGALTPVPGQPFSTGGTGVFDLRLRLGPFDSDQNICMTPDRTRLFAVNSGSNTIAVFNVGAGGTLTPVPGSPFPSGGRNPVSLGLYQDLLVVVNKNQDPRQGYAGTLPNYTVLRVQGDGSLAPVPNSTVNTMAGASPSQAHVSPLGPYVFGTDFLAGLLRSFVLNPDGTLTANPPLMLPASEFVGLDQPPAPLDLWSHAQLRILYVGFVTASKVGVYEYDTQARLTFVRTVPNSGMAVCWFRVNRAGTRLYTSNTNDKSLSVYDLSNPLLPVEVQKVTLRQPGQVFQFELDRDEQFLYAVSQRANTSVPLGDGSYLHVLRVQANGTLTEVPTSPTVLPVPPGTRPQGVGVV